MTATTASRYRVVSPMVNVRVPGGLVPLVSGRAPAWMLTPYYQNAWLPDGVHPDDIAHLLDLGMIEPVEA